ncbi:hypothetical protein SAMD00023353_0502870 [Rosellinia necatrix]|uniref:Uncharacterized protein n=1 Tax=Rosellinia necatrix TaxID=77044 RepID=A0A1S7UNA1_ROSNE|nr:hypothetical protein SAMD00023353_0502870 [Rosellinia necatrix]
MSNLANLINPTDSADSINEVVAINEVAATNEVVATDLTDSTNSVKGTNSNRPKRKPALSTTYSAAVKMTDREWDIIFKALYCIEGLDEGDQPKVNYVSFAHLVGYQNHKSLCTVWARIMKKLSDNSERITAKKDRLKNRINNDTDTNQNEEELADQQLGNAYDGRRKRKISGTDNHTIAYNGPHHAAAPPAPKEDDDFDPEVRRPRVKKARTSGLLAKDASYEEIKENGQGKGSCETRIKNFRGSEGDEEDSIAEPGHGYLRSPIKSAGGIQDPVANNGEYSYTSRLYSHGTQGLSLGATEDLHSSQQYLRSIQGPNCGNGRPVYGSQAYPGCNQQYTNDVGASDQAYPSPNQRYTDDDAEAGAWAFTGYTQQHTNNSRAGAQNYRYLTQSGSQSSSQSGSQSGSVPALPSNQSTQTAYNDDFIPIDPAISGMYYNTTFDMFGDDTALPPLPPSLPPTPPAYRFGMCTDNSKNDNNDNNGDNDNDNNDENDNDENDNDENDNDENDNDDNDNGNNDDNDNGDQSITRRK